MPTATKRPPLNLTQEELVKLQQISRSRTLQKREIERAKILIYYGEKMPITDISIKLNISKPPIYKCIDKALAIGIDAGLKDLPHKSKEPIITLEAKAWVTNIACTQPKKLGFAAEIWSRQLLANYIRKHAEKNGYPCLKLAVKATVQRILDENNIKPHKIKYYLEKRDPNFDEKMKEVLFVYQDVQLNINTETVTICVDEKPGIQAIENTSPDLPPTPEHPTITRDHEYIRHGTASILAGIDLHDGHVFAQVHHRHRSSEFIKLLKAIDKYYGKDKKIRVILDNHSAHISKETMAFLSKKPNRFIYVHTPKHGSWLNLAETLFGKMARTFLKHIRVASWDDLKRRIMLGVKEINNQPVVHKWTKFDFLKNT